MTEEEIEKAAERSVESHCEFALGTIPDDMRPVMIKQFRDGVAWQRRQNANNYYGKVRIFLYVANVINEEQKKWYRKYEIVDYTTFDDRLITNVQNFNIADVLSEEIRSTGFDLFRESIEEIVSKYADGDPIEIVADAHIEWTTSWTDCGEEHDAEGWLTNAKHRKLTKNQEELIFQTEDDVTWGQK